MATLTIKGVPDELYARLKRKAEDERRSINSQAIVCLERELLTEHFDVTALLKRADELRRKLRVPPLTDAFLTTAKSSGRA